MAAPNIVQVASLLGKTSGIALTTGGVDILENPAASGKVLKVSSLYVPNIDGSNAADATVNFVDATGPTTLRLASTVPVPPDKTLIVIDRDAPLYLEEGDKITGVASANGDLEAVVSYEELS
ncbi:MAG: hypothetical protein Q8L86_10035 [Vicinamibacterales bacterium]|nr:hypothetical protein [Vicinamibacterales bacterium]